MGHFCLHTGPQGSYYFFRELILQHLLRGEESSFLYLLPVNRAVRYFKKELVLASTNRALLDPNIYTFRSLFRTLYKQLPNRKKIISQPMRMILLRYLLNEHREHLCYFQPGWTMGPGLLGKVDHMLEEFFQFGFRADDFTAPPVTAEKKYDDFGFLITSLVEKYADVLSDESSLLTLVLNQIDVDRICQLYPDLKKIYISGFGIYSPPMIQFLLIAKKRFDIEVKIEYDANNEQLFAHTLNAHEALSAMADQSIHHEEDRTGIAGLLFNPTRPIQKRPGLKVPVFIRQALTRNDELRMIASDIKQLALNKEIPLHKIGLTFPEIEKYVPLLRNIFDEFGIPYNLSTGLSLSHSPLVQTYMQVLQVAVSGFQVREVYKLALSPFLNTDLTQEANLVYRIALKYGIQYLSGDWEKRFAGLSSPIITDIIGNGGSGRITAEEFQTIATKIKNLCQEISFLRKSRSANEFQQTFLSVLKQLGLMDWHQRENEALTTKEKEQEFRAFNKVIKIFDQVTWMLKYLYGEEKIDINDYFQHLGLVIENATYNLREWSDYGVQIMPRLEILSLDVDQLFIGGMVEGEFPRLFTRDIFFNDQEREEMGLNASEDMLGQDRFLFYQWLAFPVKQLVLSYPQVEGDKQLLPSTFFAALQEVDENLQIKHVLPEEKFYSQKSFLESISRSLRSGLTTKDKTDFQYWRIGADEKKTRSWQKSIRRLREKRRHRDITLYEGNLTGSKRVIRWLKETHSQQAFSVTALESYAFCPMQYFLQRILKLDMPEEPGNEITSLEKGNLIHKILFTFYKNLKPDEKKVPWLFEKILVEIAHDLFDVLPYNDIQWMIEKEKYFGKGKRIGLFKKFLEVEKDSLGKSGFEPTHFEFRFGSAKKGQHFLLQTEQGEIGLYGIIDRIDIHHPTGQFIVIDYKTGSGFKNIGLNQIREGSSLQLPVYIAAVRKFFQQKSQSLRPVAGVYYQVKDGENCKQMIVFADSEQSPSFIIDKKAMLPRLIQGEKDKSISFPELIDHALGFVSNYAMEIGKGNFRHTRLPLDDRCQTYCGFSRICRKDTAKLLANAR